MRYLIPALCLLASLGTSRADTVESILARMDQAAPAFHGVTADVSMIEFTKVLGDQTTETGTLQMQKEKNQVRAIIDFKGQNDARTIALFGKTVRIFYPNMNGYQDYDIGNMGQLANQLLLLGFGSSGKELASSYTISVEGQENVTGRDTTKLLLAPKDPAVKQRLDKIELWIPADAAYPLQQQFYEPSGNWRKVTYTNIHLTSPSKKPLELKLPSGAKKLS